MKIQSVGKDNTNFKQLYAPKKLNFYNFGNISQKELLKKVPELKKCSEEYDKIANIIKSTPDINFEQKDRLGISIIENILNSENFAALDIYLLSFVNTNYSRYY